MDRSTDATAISIPYVQTNGWDTVYAIKVPYINQQLEYARSATPPQIIDSFSYTAGDYNASATFAAMEMSEYSSGSYIHFRLPITQGSGKVVNQKGKPTDVTLDGGTFVIEVNLDYVNSANQPTDSEEGSNQDLQTAPNQEGDYKVHVEELDDLPDLDTVETSMVNGFLQAYLDQNFDQILQTFAVINLNNHLEDDGYGWVAPTISSYAFYGNTAVPDSSFLAVLVLTGDEEDAEARLNKLTQEVSAGAIPIGSDAGFLISAELFMENMLLPGLQDQDKFEHAADADFQFDTSVYGLTNEEKFTIDTIEYGGITYHPYSEAQDFTIKLENGRIVINVKATMDISPGIVGHMEATSKYKMEFDENTQKLTLVRDGDPDTDHHVDIATWVIVTEAVAGVIAAVIAFGVGKITESIIKGIAVLVIEEIIVAIPNWIEIQAESVAEDLEISFALLKKGIYTTKWKSTQDFHLNTALLENCLQLGGTPVGVYDDN